MPLTPDLRRGIDRIRDYLFGGGYPDPAQNAEQLSYLFYFYMFEAADAARVRAARRPGAEVYASAFDGEWTLRNPRNARTPGEETVSRSTLRWSSWANALNGERLVTWGPRGGLRVLHRGRGEGSHELHGRRTPRYRRADRALPGREPGERPPPGARRRRHQGRPIRARAPPDPAGGRARPVPDTPSRHSDHGRAR